MKNTLKHYTLSVSHRRSGEKFATEFNAVKALQGFLNLLQRRDRKLRLKSILIGTSLGGLRGLIEAVEIIRKTNVDQSWTDKFLFLIGSTFLHSLLIGIPAALLSFILFRKKHKVSYFIMGALTAVLIFSIDAVSFFTPEVPFEVEHEGPKKYEQDKDYPNILLISIDTLRSDHLDLYGHNRPTAPFISKLSRNGVVFQDCCTDIPATTPGHAGIMTGMEPTDHGSLFNAVPIKDEIATLAADYRDLGFHTAAFVSAYPLLAGVSGLNKGFDLYNQFLAPDRGNQLFYKLSFMKVLAGFRIIEAAERKAWMVDEFVTRFLKKTKQPFFLWVHYYDPHLPYEPPEPYSLFFTDKKRTDALECSVMNVWKMNNGLLDPASADFEYAEAQYDGEIALVDRMIRNIGCTLMKLGIFENTIWIITSDHGESLTEHQYYCSHSKYLYQPSLSVPLILFAGDSFSRPWIVDAPTGITKIKDILKILFLNFNYKEQEEKLIRNIAEVSFVETRTAESAEGVYLEAHEPDKNKIEEKRRAVIQMPWKLILNEDDVELYNLVEDPEEKNNLRGYAGEITEHLTNMMKKKYKNVGIEMPSYDIRLERQIRRRLESLGYIENEAEERTVENNPR